MFDVAMLVADAMRDIERRDGEYLQENEVGFNASFIVGGQISGEPLRLFRIYAEGNFIEAGIDTPYFQTGETKYGKPIIDRVITRSHAACGRREVCARFLRFDDAQQPVGRHADRSDLLRTGQPRSADAAPVRRGRRIFHCAQQGMERRHATGVSPVARVAVVTGRPRWTPLSSPVNTAATGFLRPIDRCFGGRRALAATPTAATIPVRWSWRERWPAPSSAPLVTSTISRLLVDLNRSIGHPQLFSAATRGAPAAAPRKDRRAVLPAISHGVEQSSGNRCRADGASSMFRRTVSRR